VHGAAELGRVQAASQALFGQGDRGALDKATLAAAVAEVPNAEIAGAPGQLPAVVELMAACGIVKSKSEARRAIAEGGAYVNNERVTDVDAVPSAGDLLHAEFLVLRRGRRTVGAVRVRTP
jgi:tyrosyl-tRNA synthetase